MAVSDYLPGIKAYLADGGSPSFTASGVTPVTPAALAANTATAALTPAAGRGAYAWLSGSGSASGYFIYSKDGTNWFEMVVEGTQLGVWSYAAIANVGSQAIAGQMIPIPGADQAGIQIKLLPTAVTGTVNVEITQ